MCLDFIIGLVFGILFGISIALSGLLFFYPKGTVKDSEEQITYTITLTKEGFEDLKNLQYKLGLLDIATLLNISFTITDWIIEQLRSGNGIAAITKEEVIIEELSMECFENVGLMKEFSKIKNTFYPETEE